MVGRGLGAPPVAIKGLDDEILGPAVVVHGKQLFVDDYIVEQLQGAWKVLNQPTKDPRNPLIVRDKPWEGYAIAHGSVVHDPDEGLYKLWYTVWQGTLEEEKKGTSMAKTAYAFSADGIKWEKPVFNEEEKSGIVTFTPPLPYACGASVLIEPAAKEPNRRYKMLVLGESDGTSKTLAIYAAYSADGLHWVQDPANPVATWGDGPPCTYWDAARQRYVAHTRWWPPNTRKIAQIESEDFVHWSPKVMVVDHRSGLDRPFRSAFQMMAAQPYEGIYIGLLTVHHGETLDPIPADKPWMDKINVQLTYSRNGITWQRVGPEGAIPANKQYTDAQWQRMAEQGPFLPYGDYDKREWDWGWTNSFQPPLLVMGDEIRIYYIGVPAVHWWNYHGELPEGQVPPYAYGLATLRLDGFVSVDTGPAEGTLTTRPLVFTGDALEVNADAAGGQMRVAAVDLEGNAIEGFSRADCEPIRTDSVRHVLQWNGSEDAELLQARPIRLKFYLQDTKLYSFTPRILHNHFQSNE